MMRPVILSRPENTAVGLATLGNAAKLVSLGGGGIGAPGGRGCAGRAPCGWPGCPEPAAPGGGGNGCDWMPGGGPGGSRAEGGYCCGYCGGYCWGYCCDGGGPGGSRSGGGPRPGTSRGGRNGPKIASNGLNCAAAGTAA